MTQLVISDPNLKRAEKRAEKDPRYGHKIFRNKTHLANTIIEDYSREDLISRQEVEIKDSKLESLISKHVKEELAKNGKRTKK